MPPFSSSFLCVGMRSVVIFDHCIDSRASGRRQQVSGIWQPTLSHSASSSSLYASPKFSVDRQGPLILPPPVIVVRAKEQSATLAKKGCAGSRVWYGSKAVLAGGGRKGARV